MKGYRRQFTRFALVAAAGAALILSGCSKPPREAAGKLDTPDHHAVRGNDYLDRGDLDNAARSFDMALSLDKNFSPALGGKAVTVALRSAAPGVKADQGRKLASQADDLATQARKRSKDDDERRGALVAALRVHRITKSPSNWLRESESVYKDAVKLDTRRLDADPHYFMAQAYRDAFDLQRASDLYRDVLRMNRGRTQAADSELAIVQKILRAEPGSRHGKVVAFEAALGRADISALFVEELQLGKLYERGNAARFDTGFRAPAQGGMQADQLQRLPDVTDINDHPLRSDIQEVLRLKVAGLEPNADHKFYPDARITRAEFALMVEDVLVRVTGEQKLKTRFIGQNSPFPDVRSDAFFFNAVQTVVSRNLMEPKNKIQGIFGPQDPVSGAEALLVLRLLKDELRSLVRS
jgi:tetratricopeptide (TPR) repeat protein